MITVRFRCGHEASVTRDAVSAPICAACGERVVSRVTGATPHFVGACRGPYAETKGLDAVSSPLVASRLRLKEADDAV